MQGSELNVFWDSMRLYEVKFLYKWLKKEQKAKERLSL